MHQFPPGFTKRIAVGGAIAAVAIVILGATFLGGRPTAREEQKWSLDKLDVGGQIREQNRRSLQGLK